MLAERFIPSDDIHPIDIVETVATHNAWEFDRFADDQIAMTVDDLRHRRGIGGQTDQRLLPLAGADIGGGVLPRTGGGTLRLDTCVRHV